MAAAEDNNAMMISVDVDSSTQSSSVLTSAIKQMDVSVYQVLESYFDGTWVGGSTITKSITDNGVGLPLDTSRFTTATNSMYESIYEQIFDGTIVVPFSATELMVFLAGLENVDTSNAPEASTIEGY